MGAALTRGLCTNGMDVRSTLEENRLRTSDANPDQRLATRQQLRRLISLSKRVPVAGLRDQLIFPRT